MGFGDLVSSRYSSRSYTDEKVDRDSLEAILEAGRLSPTACNRQPVRVIAASSDEALRKVSGAANIYGAPLALIVCADTDSCWKRPYDGMPSADIDASIVTAQMMYRATELGLGTVWICMFDPAALSEAFGLKDGMIPVNILAIGHSADATSPNHGVRIPMSEFARFE